MNFEIRIFANPSGYAEMSPKMPEQHYFLFTKEIVEKRNFDGERGALPKGSFSVYYTPDAYILAYHFLLSSDAQFRGNEVHVAIAVKRGFKMLKPSDTFLQLAQEFERIAVEYKSMAGGIIYNNSEKFYNIVSLVEDPQQFKFNTTCSVAKRAIVAVESQSNRDMLLSDPFRKELKDIGILFIINREDGSKVKQLIDNGRYKHIPNLNFQDARTYTLVYPDGYRVEFKDLNQELPEYTIYRQYEKPLTFSGSVGSNLDNWKISLSEDKTEYRIGLQPEKERRVYEITAIDQNNDKISLSSISVKFGQLNNGKWILEGEDIIKKINKDVFSINGYSIESITPNVDSTLLQIKACKINTIDLSELFNVLTAYNVPNPTVTLHNSYTKQHKSISMNNDKDVTLLYPYSYYYVEVPETVTTEKATLELDNSGKVKTSSLRKKKTGDITVLFSPNFPDEIKRKLDRYANVGKIKYAYYVKGHTKPTIKDKILNSYPVVISNLPLCLVRIEIMVDGYNVFKDEIDLTINPNQNVVCNLKPTNTTRLKQYCKRYLPIFFIGLILGIFIGFWIANRLSITASQAMSDKISALSADIDSLKRKNNDLHIENNGLKWQLEKGGTNGKQAEGTVLTGTSDAHKETEQNSLIRRLKSEMFTITDITTAKKILKDQGELIDDAEACLKILNLDLSKKEELSDPKSDTYKSTVNKLSIHKEIMYGIIEDEVFLACSKNDFISINDWREYKQDNY